jgi:hypothetical protein
MEHTFKHILGSFWVLRINRKYSELSVKKQTNLKAKESAPKYYQEEKEAFQYKNHLSEQNKDTWGYVSVQKVKFLRKY